MNDPHSHLMLNPYITEQINNGDIEWQIRLVY